MINIVSNVHSPLGNESPPKTRDWTFALEESPRPNPSYLLFMTFRDRPVLDWWQSILQYTFCVDNLSSKNIQVKSLKHVWLFDSFNNLWLVQVLFSTISMQTYSLSKGVLPIQTMFCCN